MGFFSVVDEWVGKWVGFKDRCVSMRGSRTVSGFWQRSMVFARSRRSLLPVEGIRAHDCLD